LAIKTHLIATWYNLKTARFLYNSDGYIYYPFVLDAEVLASEFPDFEKALEPLDRALETLFSVHKAFDDFVKKLT